jgi:hypothetical protein
MDFYFFSNFQISIYGRCYWKVVLYVYLLDLKWNFKKQLFIESDPVKEINNAFLKIRFRINCALVNCKTKNKQLQETTSTV